MPDVRRALPIRRHDVVDVVALGDGPAT